MQNSKVIPVILAGGSGTRLWPSSRQLRPKPFIRLNEQGDTLFSKTLDHIKNLINIEKIITITNKDHFFLCDEILATKPSLHNKSQYILEPFGKNTAPAIFLAARKIADTISEDAIILVLSADHLIQKQQNFQKAITQAIELATQNKLVTFGILPTEPATGFGYIQYNPENNQVISFKEKPNLEQAKHFIEQGFLWNAGIFCFKVNTLIDEFRQHNKDLADKLELCYAQLVNENTTLISTEFFNEVNDISIDYAVMEKSNNIAVIPCDIGWSDIGTWKSFSQMYENDENSNSNTPNTIHLKSKNTFVRNRATNRLITTIGVENLIIVDTPDALLIANKEHDQDVKELVNQVKKSSPDKVNFHQTVNRPWGTFTVLEEDPCYKIKRIVVKPGESLSLQMHHHRSEHWIVVSGVAKVINGDQETLINQNQSTYIPVGQKHRLTNPGLIDCILIEVQVGTYLGEDDIVRFTDIYGRK